MQKLYEMVGLFRKGTTYRSKLDDYISAFSHKNEAELKSELKDLLNEMKVLELEIGTATFKKVNPAVNNSTPNHLMLLMIAEAKVATINILLATNFQYLNNAVSADHIRSQLEKKLFEYNEKNDVTPDFKAELDYLQHTFLDKLHRLVNPATGFTLLDTSETHDDFLKSNSPLVKKPVLPQSDAAKTDVLSKDTKKLLEQRAARLSTLSQSAKELEVKAQENSKASKRIHSAKIK
jgi:hypothetical protein